MKKFIKDKLTVKITGTRTEMGGTEGKDIADKIKELQKVKNEINIIFAAAPSQNETLAALAASEGIDWTKINAFHMDEYIGLDENAPQKFGNFLKNAIFEKLPFKSINYINGGAENTDAECERYTKRLESYPTDIVCMGIGENGHIAFNDPPVADFNDKKIMKIVILDEICRRSC